MEVVNEKEMETTMVAVVGVVLLVAGVKHGSTTLVEQWRALVFLFLNLLLLTILFTSFHSNSTKSKTKASSTKNKKNRKKNTKRRFSSTSASTSWPMQVEDLFKIEESSSVVLVQEQEQKQEQVHEDEVEVEKFVSDEGVVDEVEVDEGHQVSKEELNARVESFIMMFRQQLALDAKERSRGI